MKSKKFYLCKQCGNLIYAVTPGAGELVCCGEPMIELIANTTDASKEKHVPVITRNKGEFIVNVGSVLHPMTPTHYINWIALESNGTTQIFWLTPDKTPSAFFYENSSHETISVINLSEEKEIPNCEGSPCNFTYTEDVRGPVTAYAYCNLHGLWTSIL